MKTVDAPADQPRPNPDNWTTVGGAARMLYVSERTVLRMIDDGRLTGYEFHMVRGARFLWVPEVENLAQTRQRVPPPIEQCA